MKHNHMENAGKEKPTVYYTVKSIVAAQAQVTIYSKTLGRVMSQASAGELTSPYQGQISARTHPPAPS